MPKRAAPLYAKQLERWRPDPVRTLERIDGATPGLRARLAPKGPISWSLSIRVDGVRQRIALGKNLGLAEARKLAEQTRAAIARGEDPGGVRRARVARRRAAANGIGTLGSVIASYYEHGPGASLRSGAASRNLIERVFARHLTRPAVDVRAAELQLSIDGWRSKASAKRVAAGFRPIVRWASKRGLMTKGEPLEAPTQAAPKQRVLTRGEVGALLGALEARGAGAAAWFMLLTGARREEVCGATWGEVKDRLWTIPGGRRKNTRPSAKRAKQDHVIPLSRQARALLDGLRPGEADGLVFTKEGGGRLSDLDTLVGENGAAARVRGDAARAAADLRHFGGRSRPSAACRVGTTRPSGHRRGPARRL
jgi:integrase